MVLLALTGCQTLSEKDTWFKTLAAVGYSVDGAMVSYADAQVAGLTTPEQDARVAELHGRYQPVYNAAVRAARYDYSTMTPEEVAAVAAELTELIFSILNPA